MSMAATADGGRDMALAAAIPAKDAGKAAGGLEAREKFLPVTRYALMDRLTLAKSWPEGDAVQARRFMRYLDYWRRHSYSAELLDLEQTYEPFSPDSDLLTTRTFKAGEKQEMQKRLVEQMAGLLEQANFERINPADVKVILTKDSHYGLDLHVDMHAFEEILIYYRGAASITERRRSAKKLYLWHEEVEIPIFQRLFILFKLKPEEDRIREVMAEQRVDRKEAERIIKRLRGMLPKPIKSDFVYMKLFKNIPRSDVEMIFPNTKVRFRLFDKIKFGVTAGSGLGMGLFGTIGKIAVVSTNPIAMVGALAGLGGVVMASQLKSGSPTYGLMYELYVIAAVVVGGTSLAGGDGKVLGTLIGAFIIAVIQNGMNLTGIESYTQKIVLGGVILAAVLLDMLKKKSWPWAGRIRKVAG